MRQILLVIMLLTNISLYGQEVKVIKYQDLEQLINEESEKIKIINFWATWCAPCVKELPQFEAIQKKYGNKDTEVILVSFDFVEQIEKTKAFAKRKELKSDLFLLDETDYNSFIDKVDPRWSGAIPATLMIDSRRDKKEFYEKEFKTDELEKTYLAFRN